MATSKCLICSQELLRQNTEVKINSESDNLSKISRWKLLSLESLCMLFGLPTNNSLITSFTKKNGNNKRRRVWLCNQCLGELSDIHFVFWQLHNLELKMIKLQKIIFQRLMSRWKDPAEETATEDAQNIEDKEFVENMEKLFKDINSGSINWPKGVYISRWKEALINLDRILLSHDVPNEVDNTGNVKLEVDRHHDDDTELHSLENEKEAYQDLIEEDNSWEDEEYHWDDKDNEEDLESSKKPRRRKSQRQVKSKKSSCRFEEESPPNSPDNQEGISDDDYFIDEVDNVVEQEAAEEEDDDPDSDYPEVLESPKKRRRRSQGKNSKPRKINNYKTNSEGKYLCTEDPLICSRTYDIKKRLTKHIIDFHQGRKYVCTEEGCPQKFLTEFKLNSHLKNDHGIQRVAVKPNKLSDKSAFLCTEDPDICSRTYDRQNLLNKHIRQFHEERKHVCTEEGCVQKFLTELKLSYHLKRVHGVELDTQVKPQRLIIDPNELPDDKPVFKCTVDPSICKRIYPKLKFLNGHIKRFHKGRNLNCDQEGCVQKFLTQVKLSQHLKLDHGIGRKETVALATPKKIKDPNETRHCDAPHVCDICGVTVPRKLMKSHVTAKHLGFGRFKCDLCGMDFKNGDEIRIHEDLHTNYASTFPFTCVAQECRQVFTNSGDLKIHVNKNHLSSGLKCEVCGVMKPNKVMLEKHVLIHEKERNLICEECGKAYFSATMLRLHIESSHLGKKVSCEICKKEFLRMSSLKRHRLSHQRIKPYKCGVCGKMFFNTTQRKRHEQTHAGLKNYECELCGKRFKQKNNLNQHRKTQAHKDKVGKVEKVDSNERIEEGEENLEFKNVKCR